jgi:lipoprotein-anchoring transpeptidase ErfK/SrfK
MKRSLPVNFFALLLAILPATTALQADPLGQSKPYPGEDVESPASLPSVSSVAPPIVPVEPPKLGGIETEPVKPIVPVRPVIKKITLRVTNPKNDHIAYENARLTIKWSTTGDVSKVRLYYYGDRTKLGGNSRGDFGVLIADSALNTGSYVWTVPWIDASAFRLRVAALDASMKAAASDEIAVQFRPKEMLAIKEKTFILVIKRQQRLYYVKEGHLKRVHLVSTALDGFWTPTMRPGSYDPERGAMGKVFSKDPAPTSRMYDVVMPWWLQITESGSHGIHATSPRFYDELGGPASHGCVRQHRADAEVLYGMVSVGTPVYIY